MWEKEVYRRRNKDRKIKAERGNEIDWEIMSVEWERVRKAECVKMETDFFPSFLSFLTFDASRCDKNNVMRSPSHFSKLPTNK